VVAIVNFVGASDAPHLATPRLLRNAPLANVLGHIRAVVRLGAHGRAGLLLVLAAPGLPLHGPAPPIDELCVAVPLLC